MQVDERMVWKTLLESPHVCVVVTGVDGTIQFFNKGAENMLGYKAEEMVGKQKAFSFHDPSEAERHAQELQQAFGVKVGAGREGVISGPLITGQPEEHIWTYTRKDGSHYKGLTSLQILRDAKGEMQGFFAVSIPIPEALEKRMG